MREIKFRAKRIDDGRWVYGQYFKTPLTDENSGTKPEDGWFFLCGEERHCIVQDNVSFVIDGTTLGQFSGLKDNNGTEIFDGFLVTNKTKSFHGNGFRGKNLIMLVDWDQNECCYKLIIQSDKMFGFKRLTKESSKDVEVIGNKYDNPELLK